MFEQIFESEAPRYFLPSERTGIPDGIGLDALYNPYLVTPPRVYGESISGFTTVFTAKERTPYSDFAIYVVAVTDSIYWPSYGFVRWRFDGITGQYLDRSDVLTGGLTDLEIWQSRDGSLWRVSNAGEVFEVDPLNFEEIDGTRQTVAKYGAGSLDLPLVDRSQDLIVMRTGALNFNQIGVYDFTSGALVRTITLSGQAEAIFPEDERRCYVRCTNGVLNLVNYSTGAVLSALRTPEVEAGALHYFFAWDRFLRRLLVAVHRDDDTDGACLSTVLGYHPVPLPVGMTQPVPLKAPRANRRTPFLVRVYGDAGEGLPGVKVTPVPQAAEPVGMPPFTDRDGEAVLNLLPAAAGSDTLTVTADV